MTVFKRNWTARSRMAVSSACCCWVVNPGRDGQSMFFTVAIHAPRNSRGGAGGVMFDGT